MGSEPDLSQSSNNHLIGVSSNFNSMSRDSSFASVATTSKSNSSSNTYHTAQEELNNSLNSSSSLYLSASAGDGDSLKDKFKTVGFNSIGRRESGGGGDTTEDSNSATLEEADSLRSYSSGSIAGEGEGGGQDLDVGDNNMGSSGDKGGSLGDISPHLSLSNSSSENAIEVRDDISRICNTIAESEELDNDKKKEIEVALNLGDLEKLGRLATSNGGLLSNALRTRAWPLLLNVSSTDITRNEYKKIPTFYPDVPEKISSLVHLDVARVLKRFPPGLTDPQQDHLQSYLNNLICSVLQEKRQAYYYQGFHDISLTFLLVSISQNAPYLAYLCLNKIIVSNLSPYMEKTMDKTHDVIHVLFSIIEAEDLTLFNKLVVECKCPVGFCLPWVLTWFSHTLPSDTDVFRLYDFMLGSQEQLSQPYLIPIFVSAMLILRNSRLIKEDDSLTDIASMHHRLAKLSTELESLEPWLADSVKLMKKYNGQEEKLLSRGVEIKAFQNRLWNDDNNNRPRRRPPPPGVLASVSRFLFVRYRLATVSFVILGTAFLLQSKYGGSVYNIHALRSIVLGYAPERFRNILKHWLVDDSNDE